MAHSAALIGALLRKHPDALKKQEAVGQATKDNEPLTSGAAPSAEHKAVAKKAVGLMRPVAPNPPAQMAPMPAPSSTMPPPTPAPIASGPVPTPMPPGGPALPQVQPAMMPPQAQPSVAPPVAGVQAPGVDANAPMQQDELGQPLDSTGQPFGLTDMHGNPRNRDPKTGQILTKRYDFDHPGQIVEGPLHLPDAQFDGSKFDPNADAKAQGYLNDIKVFHGIGTKAMEDLAKLEAKPPLEERAKTSWGLALVAAALSALDPTHQAGSAFYHAAKDAKQGTLDEQFKKQSTIYNAAHDALVQKYNQALADGSGAAQNYRDQLGVLKDAHTRAFEQFKFNKTEQDKADALAEKRDADKGKAQLAEGRFISSLHSKFGAQFTNAMKAGDVKTAAPLITLGMNDLANAGDWDTLALLGVHDYDFASAAIRLANNPELRKAALGPEIAQQNLGNSKARGSAMALALKSNQAKYDEFIKMAPARQAKLADQAAHIHNITGMDANRAALLAFNLEHAPEILQDKFAHTYMDGVKFQDDEEMKTARQKLDFYKAQAESYAPQYKAADANAKEKEAELQKAIKSGAAAETSEDPDVKDRYHDLKRWADGARHAANVILAQQEAAQRKVRDFAPPVPSNAAPGYFRPPPGGVSLGNYGKGKGGPKAGKGRSQYHTQITSAAIKHGIDPDLADAIVTQESGYDPRSTSNKGAAGLWQVMPGEHPGVKNIYDPTVNSELGAKEFAAHLKRWKGSLPLALAAYNAGDGAVAKYHGIPPYKETQDYVRRVMAHYNQLKGNKA